MLFFLTSSLPYTVPSLRYFHFPQLHAMRGSPEQLGHYYWDHQLHRLPLILYVYTTGVVMVKAGFCRINGTAGARLLQAALWLLL